MPKKKKKASLKLVGKQVSRKATPEELEAGRRIKAGKETSASASNRLEKKKKPVIKLKGKKKKKGVVRKLAEAQVKVAGSLKTTAVLGTALTGLVGGAGAVAGVRAGLATRAGTGLVSRTAIFGAGNQLRSITTQRAAVGKAAHQAPKILNKIANTVRPQAARFATNQKSSGLTKSFLLKAGMSTGIGLFVGAVGSYPFAGFIKEEAVQQTGFAFNSAERNNDIEGMELAIEATRDILGNIPTIIEQIPYNNIIVQLRGYFEAVAVKLNQDERTLAIKREEIDDPTFEEQRISSEESARERELKRREEDTEFFEKQREESRARELEDRQQQAEYFRLIREGRFEEAQELLDSLTNNEN